MHGEGDKAAVHLTDRECEVLTMVSQGLSSKQVAARLGIAPRTVDTYIEHIRLKIGAANRSHMIALAVAGRLLTVAEK